MSGSRATYLDSSAIVKLVVDEPESRALRTYFRRRLPLVTSAVARTEVARALLDLGETAAKRGQEVLRRLDLVRLNDRVLDAAGALRPASVRSLDSIHLATAQLLGSDLRALVTYDDRLAETARSSGINVAAPE